MSPHPAELPDRRTDQEHAPFGGGGRRDDAAVLALRSLSRPDLLQVIVAVAETVGAALGVDRVALWHYDRERTVMVCAAAWDRGAIVPEALVLSRDAHPECWAALHAARSLAIVDTIDHPMLVPLRDAYIARHRISAMIGSSVQIDGGALGFLSVEHRGGTRQWTALEERFVHAMADRAGLAIQVQAQRRMDSAAVQARRMEALAFMAGRIAHDFNNKLSVILASATAARALHARGTDIAEDLDAIEGAVQQANTLTRKLLYFGRNETAMRETFDLNESLRASGEFLQATLPSDIRLQLLPDPQPLTLHAERAFVDQAVQTLCTNAVDAMPAGGSLTLAARRLTVDGTRLTHGVALPEGTYAHLRVLDTGEGIAPHALSRVFEPFYTTRGRARTGLGLSMVYGGMRQHDGYISVESVQGRGTVFHLFFPLAERVG